MLPDHVSFQSQSHADAADDNVHFTDVISSPDRSSGHILGCVYAVNDY